MTYYSSGSVELGNSVWSPDGKALIYGWKGNIYRINSFGEYRRQLTHNNGIFTEPTWSPRNNQIVYMYDASRSHKFTLHAMDDQGNNDRQLVQINGQDVFGAIWSPDGRFLGYFATNVYYGDPEEYGFSRFQLMDLNKGTVIQEPNEVETVNDLQWDHQSQKVAFTGFAGRNYQIYVMQTDGTYERLTDGNYDIAPAWSPDGNQVAFYSERDTKENWLGKIYVIRMSDKTVTPLTDIVNRAYRLRWSPDGHRIVFTTSGYADENSTIYVMNSDGSEMRHLYSNALLNSQLSWSPDGKKLAFQGLHSLVTVDATTATISLDYDPGLPEPLSFLPLDYSPLLALLLIVTGPLLAVPSRLIATPLTRSRTRHFLVITLTTFLTLFGCSILFFITAGLIILFVLLLSLH